MISESAKVAHKYEAPDYFLLDELFTETQRLIRQCVRDWLNQRSAP